MKYLLSIFFLIPVLFISTNQSIQFQPSSEYSGIGIRVDELDSIFYNKLIAGFVEEVYFEFKQKVHPLRNRTDISRSIIPKETVRFLKIVYIDNNGEKASFTKRRKLQSYTYLKDCTRNVNFVPNRNIFNVRRNLRATPEINPIPIPASTKGFMGYSYISGRDFKHLVERGSYLLISPIEIDIKSYIEPDQYDRRGGGMKKGVHVSLKIESFPFVDDFTIASAGEESLAIGITVPCPPRWDETI